jgi:hypothetical protein
MPDRTNLSNRPIYIALETPTETFTTNDPVRGKVRIDPKSRPNRVTVTFQGRTKCAITHQDSMYSHSTYKSKQVLFTYSSTLFASESRGESYDILNHGGGITSDNRVELPFEFRFPDRTPARKDADINDRFAHKEGSVLPPNFNFYSSGLSITTGDEQLVEYYLEATMSHREQVRCPLKFHPPSPNNPIEEKEEVPKITYMPNVGNAVYIRTHKLDPDYDPNPHLKTRIKNKFKSNYAAPFLNFRLKTLCPSSLTTSQPLHLTLVLEHIKCSPEISNPPPIFLRRIRVKLLSTVHVCVPKTYLFSSEDEVGVTHEDKSVLLDKRYTDGDGLLLHDGGVGIDTSRLPGAIVPGFKTYVLGLEYGVEVRVWGECEGENFEIVPVRGIVGVVSHRRSGDGAIGDVGERLVSLPALGDDVAPPRYREVEGVKDGQAVV